MYTDNKDSFVEDDVKDINEDSNNAPQHDQRLSKCPAKVLVQQPRRGWSRLRFLTEESPSLAPNGLTPAFSSQSQDDHESRIPLEDPKVEGYLELEVSDDEKSKIEDNSDPESGVEVNRLVEGPNQDD
ncbi:hypothetical protein HOY80DRAFT_1031967 [Tuber brumale]|nr:hypothetical protein HOY80DRAFT_1031967 [Tuber brumale]